MLVGLPVVGRKSRHLVEYLRQEVLDLLFNRDSSLKEVQVSHLDKLRAVLNSVPGRVLLLQVANNDLMNLQS